MQFKSFLKLKKFLGKPKSCEDCGSSKNLDYHHKDFNKRNNDTENIKILCRSCHQKVHWPFKKNGFKFTHKGKVFSEIHLKRLSESAKNNPKSESHKLKIKLALTGNKNGVGNKNMLGKKHSLESRIKMSISKLGNKNSAGHNGCRKKAP